VRIEESAIGMHVAALLKERVRLFVTGSEFVLRLQVDAIGSRTRNFMFDRLHAGEHHQRMGSRSFRRQFGDAAKITVKTTIVSSGRITAHATPMTVCL
jgi:hypothetical protein